MIPPSSPSLAQVALYILGHHAHCRHSLFQLCRCDVEVLGPIPQLPLFIYVDANAIGRTALAQIVCHCQSPSAPRSVRRLTFSPHPAVVQSESSACKGRPFPTFNHPTPCRSERTQAAADEDNPKRRGVADRVHATAGSPSQGRARYPRPRHQQIGHTASQKTSPCGTNCRPLQMRPLGRQQFSMSRTGYKGRFSATINRRPEYPPGEK